MPFQVSPGVAIREIDLTTIVPAVSTTEGAIAGPFRWGPIDERVLVDSEVDLVNKFGKPTNFNPETWFTAASFLGYGNRLYVSRAANTTGVSPSVSAIIESGNANIILATGNTSSLSAGLSVIYSDNGYVLNTGVIGSITNSSSFALTLANAVISSSNTKSIAVNTENGNTTVIVTSGNTQNLSNTMYVYIADNSNMLGKRVVSVTNSTAFVVDVAPTVTTSSNNITLGVAYTVDFVSNTVFNAVANTARVANLESAIVKNEDHFTANSRTFDTDIKFVAKYPGEIGNSLKVSVCGNSEGFSSQVNLANLSASNITFTVATNSNTSTITVIANSNSAIATSITNFKTKIQATDLVEVGNTLLGTQLMKVMSFGNTTFYGSNVAPDLYVTATGSAFTLTNSSGGSANVFISYNGANVDITDGTSAVVNTSVLGLVLANGMKITSATSNSAVGLTVNAVTGARTFTTTTALSANITSGNTITVTPVGQFVVNFEDPYSLADNYTFDSANTATRNVQRYWEFVGSVDTAPGQSEYVRNFGNSAINSDELHVIVTDDGGKITGIPGTILEAYRGLSRATDAKSIDGAANYWKDVINDASQYVWAVNDLSGASSATAVNLANSTLDVTSLYFNLGKDGQDETTLPLNAIITAYDKFASAEDVDVSLILQGRARSFQLANYLIDNICEKRLDCVAFISPQKADVVNNIGREAASIVSFRNNVRSTSYGVMDSGYKYMYDRYNDLYRWVPLNGDTAGLCVRTDTTNDPWWSPAGFNRGQIKNLVKLAYNPRKADRDTLYKAGVNPVVTFPGQGTILFGDKTLLAKPSAFDRINVRRLFIVLEKAISTASKFTLFEFNDAFTRSQFKNLVVPYLRDVQGRRGIYDFLVVCDETNNTPEVIDRNEFIGDIYIKPARSINFIQLNFIAVRTGVAFSEIVGKF